nr:RNA-directed DNA polymerase, eukaryota, nucleotide-binding alpha-beta plait domain protein [Tanacetum cinerariifolium]
MVLKPALVLEESCSFEPHLTLSLVGKLKEFDSLPNLKKILVEEGFTDIIIRYMEGFRVLFQSVSKVLKDNFMAHVGVNSWFSKLHQTSNSFYVAEKVAWIEIEGVPLCARCWAPNFTDDYSDFDEESVDSKFDNFQKEVDLFSIKACWGFLSFDSAVSPSVGNSGGILCVWDSNMFHRDNSTVLDYFIAIMDRWKGDVIVMGDFNEVRSEDERYGSIFNARGADAFSLFISTGGLAEVPSGDYGPTPFRFFHNSLDLKGFEAFVTDTWRSINIIESNAMLKMAKKLKLIKGHIRVEIKSIHEVTVVDPQE